MKRFIVTEGFVPASKSNLSFILHTLVLVAPEHNRGHIIFWTLAGIGGVEGRCVHGAWRVVLASSNSNKHNNRHDDRNGAHHRKDAKDFCDCCQTWPAAYSDQQTHRRRDQCEATDA